MPKSMMVIIVTTTLLLILNIFCAASKRSIIEDKVISLVNEIKLVYKNNNCENNNNIKFKAYGNKNETVVELFCYETCNSLSIKETISIITEKLNIEKTKVSTFFYVKKREEVKGLFSREEPDSEFILRGGI